MKAGLISLLTLVAVGGARAQTTMPDSQIETSTDGNVIEKTAESQSPVQAALLSFDRPFKQMVIDAKRRLDDVTGLKLTLESTTIYQVATDSPGDRDAAVHSAGLFGTWTIHQSPNGVDGIGVGFALESRRNFSGNDFVDLTGDIGTLWSPNDSTSDDYTKVSQLWFGQQISNGQFFYLVGKIDPGAYIGGNRFAGSGNTQFFSQPLAGNPARALPDNGIGLLARWSPTAQWHVQGSVSDSDARSDASPFTSIRGNWGYAVEVAFKPNIPSLGEGRYRLLGYYRESDPTTYGWALSIDQNLGQDWGVFLRYGGNDGDIAAIEHLVAGGFSLLKPFGRDDDEAGIGASWSRPADDTLRDQVGMEAYYRLQLSELLQVSTSAQWIIDPAASDEPSVAVFGLRLRMLL